jgi:hypothetical protein
MATHQPIAPAESWSEPGKYDAAWEPLRRAERNAQYSIGVFVGAPVLLGLINATVSPIPDVFKTILSAPLVAAALVAWPIALVNTIRVKRFPCPRCGARFYNHWSMSPGRTCRHCNLFIYQARD